MAVLFRMRDWLRCCLIFDCVSGSVVCIFVLVSGWLWFVVVFCVGLCFVTLCLSLCVVYLFCIVAGLA